ncbi:ESX secretion-associated protein EspG [Actinopolyspora mortivallis]|uniref:ESX secretion-associated protein EspG n=1 Tax=Actinopolyspora mortivallis TaxID=33906 RepID=A0A2T0GWG3_ACTMO|nr:ESX secretion-associated protein EspG [Actinopolyspora mortivallis]PRW63455.1 ESX secretion-associated protein EspG [Actinopolyspora mortivallis]
MTRNRISISPLAAAYLCERYDTHPHPMLRVGAPREVTDEQQRRAAHDAGRRELQQQGLIDTDEVHPFLEDAWTLLSHPPLAFGLAVRDNDGENFNAVLVEHGRSTLRAYQADGRDHETLEDIVLSSHEYGGPAGNTVQLLGDPRAAPGGSASLPTELLDRAGKHMAAEPGGSTLTALNSAGVRGEDARALARALNSTRHLEALITLRLYDNRVRRVHTLPFGLQVFTTDEGAYFTQRRTGGDGREWFTLAPADGRKITAKLDEMTNQLRASLQR